ERALCTHTLHNAVHGYAHHVAHTALLGPASTKHAHVLSLLLTELAKPAPERVDWVFWFDAGVVVLNPWVGLELFLPPAGDGLDGVEMLCQEGRGLAVFAVRVAEWAVRLFGAVVAEAGVDGDGDGVLRRLRGGERWRGGVVAVPGHWFGDDSVARTETPSSSSSSSSPRKPSPLRPGVFVAHFSTLSTDTQTPAAKSKRRMQFWLQRAEQHLPAWEVPVALTGYPQSVDAFW
ncbi:glycosyltransferase family 34 protein, partial [Saccharata proteae CBS 121410]